VARVRSARACSWDIEYPEGVVRSFQVNSNSVEPSKAVLARNLLSKDESRSTGGDEAVPLGPKVLLVGEAALTTRRRERGAWAASAPHVSIVGPSGVSEGSAPDTDATEEVTLSVAGDVCGLEISDRSLIDDSCRDLSRGDKVARPLGRIRIVIIVERCRQCSLEHEFARIDAKKARRGALLLHIEREIT
jgi:hypothetical protein